MPGSLSVRKLDDEVIARLGEGSVDFERLAAEFRKLTADRHHTPSEILQRESRDER